MKNKSAKLTVTSQILLFSKKKPEVFISIEWNTKILMQRFRNLKFDFSIQHTGRVCWNITHHTSYHSGLHTITFPLFDHPKDYFCNLYAVCQNRCISQMHCEEGRKHVFSDSIGIFLWNTWETCVQESGDQYEV